MKAFTLFLTLFVFSKLFAQEIIPLNSQEKISIRGLSVVDNQTIWVSGTQGKIGLSIDGGKTWKWKQVKGFEKTDFRDIEGFDANTAIIMGIDSPGVVLKTKDGGQSWLEVYRDNLSGIFMDAMEFWEDGSGIIVGDPIDHKPYILKTKDWGEHWERYTNHQIADLKDGESMFASSGTNIRKKGKAFVMITGGKHSRILLDEKWHTLPLIQGETSTGANSIALSKKRFIVVGGDFTKDTNQTGNAAISKNGMDWFTPQTPPHGYRSCVEYLGGKTFITCGTSGVDISTDNGQNWRLLSKDSYHVIRQAKNGNAVFLAGSKGQIALLKQ